MKESSPLIKRAGSIVVQHVNMLHKGGLAPLRNAIIAVLNSKLDMGVRESFAPTLAPQLLIIYLEVGSHRQCVALTGASRLSIRADRFAVNASGKLYGQKRQGCYLIGRLGF